MVVQAAVVQIDRADGRLAVIADEDLRVNEARLVLINLYTVFKQPAVIRVRKREGDLLVRHMRQDELDLHAAARGVGQRRDHLVVNDEIRRHDVYVTVGTVDDIHIDHLADEVAVERAVAIGDDIAHFLFMRRLRHVEILAVDFGRKVHGADVPHLQKHQRQAAHGVAAQGNGCVLPVAEARGAVDVLVGEVDAACEADLAVDDHDLAVVAVVVVRGDERAQRREHLAGNAELFELFGVGIGQQRDRAGAVVQHAHLDARVDLFLENFKDAAPHVALPDDEILEEDEVLGLLELVAHDRERIVAEGEVLRLCVLIAGEAAGIQVGGKALELLR